MYDAGNPELVLCDNLVGRDEEGGGEKVKREGTCVYLRPIHVDVHQRSSQDCNVITLQLNRK